MKKLISTFLCLALTTSMISTAALAAEPTIQDTISKNQEYVINESSPLKSQPTTIAEIDEMFRVLDNAILTNDSKKEAEISNSLEAAGVREVTLAEILAKTGVENGPETMPVGCSNPRKRHRIPGYPTSGASLSSFSASPVRGFRP